MTSAKYLAEFMGTAGLIIVVIGSGIMGETLAGGNNAIALLANSIATGAGLYVLIQTFAPLSGAHFNPVVSSVSVLQKQMSIREFFNYVTAQVDGAISGVFVTHLMFGMSLLQLSIKDRSEPRLLASEVVATFGLVLVITILGKRSPGKIPACVALYITAAYWCTSSTSFANPAVTIARSLTDTFSGIRWINAPGFIVAQVAAGVLAALCAKALEAKS